MLYHLYLILIFSILSCSHKFRRSHRHRNIRVTWTNNNQLVSKTIECNRNEKISKIDFSVLPIKALSGNDTSDPKQQRNETAWCEGDIKETLEQYNRQVKKDCEGRKECKVTLQLRHLCEGCNRPNIQGHEKACLATEGKIHYNCEKSPEQPERRNKKEFLPRPALITLGIVINVIVTLAVVAAVFCCWKYVCCKQSRGHKSKQSTQETQEEVTCGSMLAHQQNQAQPTCQTSFQRSENVYHENIYQEITDAEQPVPPMVRSSNNEVRTQDETKIHLSMDNTSENSNNPVIVMVENCTYDSTVQVEPKSDDGEIRVVVGDKNTKDEMSTVSHQHDSKEVQTKDQVQDSTTSYSMEAVVHMDDEIKKNPESKAENMNKHGEYVYAYGHFKLEGRDRFQGESVSKVVQ